MQRLKTPYPDGAPQCQPVRVLASSHANAARRLFRRVHDQAIPAVVRGYGPKTDAALTPVQLIRERVADRHLLIGIEVRGVQFAARSCRGSAWGSP